MTFLCRRHGIVCPEAVDYVNYIRPYDDQFEHPKGGGATVVAVWRKAYSLSTATPPEVWRQGRFLPEGHTVSISDIYFVAHFLQVAASQVGSATKIEARSVVADRGSLDVDILIKCVGFEINDGVERTVGRSHLKLGWMVDDSLFAAFESHPDGNFSGGAFGSYVDAMGFRCMLLARYWHVRDVTDAALQGSALSTARITTITSSQEGVGMSQLMEHDGDTVFEMTKEHVLKVLKGTMATWTPEEFLEHNQLSWDRAHEEIRSRAAITATMPFVFSDVVEVVRSEAPELFKDDSAVAVDVPVSSERLGLKDAVQTVEVTRIGDADGLPENEMVRAVVSMPPADRQVHVESIVLQTAGEMAASDSIAAETPLMDAGIDSLAATELVGRLSTVTSLALTPTLVFEYASPRKIAAHVLHELKLSQSQMNVPVALPRSLVGTDQTDEGTHLGVCSATGRWPAGMTHGAPFWSLLHASGDAISSVPSQRWVLSAIFAEGTLSEQQRECVSHGGWIAGAARFDSRHFGMSPAESRVVDPQQRVLLEVGASHYRVPSHGISPHHTHPMHHNGPASTCAHHHASPRSITRHHAPCITRHCSLCEQVAYECLHAAYRRKSALLESDTATVIGYERPDWIIVRQLQSMVTAFYGTESHAVASGRLSFVLGLQGPTVTVDTACSSGLVASHLACNAVQLSQCVVATASAVSMKLTLTQTLTSTLMPACTLHARTCTHLHAPSRTITHHHAPSRACTHVHAPSRVCR